MGRELNKLFVGLRKAIFDYYKTVEDETYNATGRDIAKEVLYTTSVIIDATVSGHPEYSKIIHQYIGGVLSEKNLDDYLELLEKQRNEKSTTGKI